MKSIRILSLSSFFVFHISCGKNLHKTMHGKCGTVVPQLNFQNFSVFSCLNPLVRTLYTKN